MIATNRLNTVFYFKEFATVFLFILLVISPTSIHSQITVFHTQAEVDAFDSSITELVGSLVIETEGGTITNLSNLSNLASVSGTLLITNNSELTSLQGLNSLISVGLDLEIINNDQLLDINALCNINSVGNDIKVNDNLNLLSLDGLKKTKVVKGDFDITNNEKLQSLVGLDSITFVGGYLRFIGNDQLIDLQGLGLLKEVGGYFRVADNDNLLNFNGIKRLQKIGGFLSVRDNIHLIEINDLSNLNRVGGYLAIIKNVELVSLNGLNSIILIGGYLRVQFNTSLSDCCSIKRFINSQTLVMGDITISSNALGCSSIFNVQETDCGLEAAFLVEPSCTGLDNGSITVFVVGEESLPIYYEWVRDEDGAMGSGFSNDDYFTIDNLASGTYNVIIYTDTQEEFQRNNIFIESDDGSIFEIVEIVTSNSVNGFPNGKIELTYEGGAPPFAVIWSGAKEGGLPNVSQQNVIIPDLIPGEYTVSVIDNNSTKRELSVTLLNDDAPEFECDKPFDIVILNDISSSVDETEYKESQKFFVDLINETNVGQENVNSRVSLIEWSGPTYQEVRVPITGDIIELDNYVSLDRLWAGSTSPNEALLFGKNYLEENARDSVLKIIILSTDASGGQLTSSLISIANQIKSEGYIIITIAFDQAFTDPVVRGILSQVGSANGFAPGAPSYAELNQEVAKYIVNVFICPLDPGSPSSVYLDRDGSIEINDIDPLGNCPFPEYADVTFTVSAYEELSIPASTPISFYLNDPNLTSATLITNWVIPCAIAVGESETYTVTLPIQGPSLVYVVLNDDGLTNPPILFPITDLKEIRYNNNIDFARICVDEIATIIATKYTTTPIPVCDTIVNYTVNVCNISEADAFDVTILEEAPTDFELISTTVNLNECATADSTLYEIPVGCCITINYSYSAANAAQGIYDDQDVILSGPDNQNYFSYEGLDSQDEDVTIDGTIDCPSDIVEFTKQVNLDESCDDRYLTYTFTINNEMNIPLQGLTFKDVLPSPCQWTYQPYNKSGISIANMELSGTVAEFVIAQIDAETIATFSIDVFLGTWTTDATLTNQATLSGATNLSSNIVSTDIISTPTIESLDTVRVGLNAVTISLSAIVSGDANLYWTSGGDGTFIDSIGGEAIYVLGPSDKENQFVNLYISLETECHQTGQLVVIEIDDCQITIENLLIGDCHDNGTMFLPYDDTYEITFTTSLFEGGDSNMYFLTLNGDTLSSHTYGDSIVLQLDADGLFDTLLFVDTDLEYCITELLISQEHCSTACEIEIEYFDLSACNYNNGTDDTFELTFNATTNNAAIENSYYLIIAEDTIGTYQYGIDHTIIINNNGEEALSIILQDINDCAEEIEINIDVFDLDIQVILPEFICSDTEAYIELLTENENISYQWGPEECILAGANSSNPSILVNDNESKILTLQITNDISGCILDYEYTIPVIVFDIDIQADPDTTINAGDIIEIYVSENEGGESYEWNNGNNDISQIVAPEETTTYIVTVTDSDGCSDSDEITITVVPLRCEIFVPNSFTPNGDGINDHLFVRSNTISSMELYIYDRWGEEVFHTNNQDISWDGTYKGELLTADSFAFYLSVTCTNGNQRIEKGNISILR